jgi:hypothetical protein
MVAGAVPLGAETLSQLTLPTVLVRYVLTAAVQLSAPDDPALVICTFWGEAAKPLPETKFRPPALHPNDGAPAAVTVSVTGTVIAVDPLLNTTCPV